MKQSLWMSLVESIVNVVDGYVVAVGAQLMVFPLFRLHATLGDNLMIGLIFTGVSLVRSFLLRRVFETLRLRQAKSSSSMAACTTNPVR